MNKVDEGSQRMHRRTWIVSIWLGLVVALTFSMIIIGGLTRLTDSGLSITEWKPVTGAMPPLSQGAWQEEFEKYKQIPEYQLQNRGMSLAEFQFIYWWEWGHRQLGRTLGLAFALPLLAFWAMGWIPRQLRGRMVLILVLGGLQGFVGWWMVSSGLTENVDVSHYRLAAHLGLAFVLFGALVWTLADVAAPRTPRQSPRWIMPATSVFAVLIFAQIILGALVAGLDAGRIYTDWPLMGGQFVPQAYGAISPWWADAFENRASVQFHHRMMAYALVAIAVGLAVAIWRATTHGDPLRRYAVFLLGAVGAQTILGVITLVHAAPLSLSAFHQGLAAILFGVAVLAVRASWPPPQRAASAKMAAA